MSHELEDQYRSRAICELYLCIKIHPVLGHINNIHPSAYNNSVRWGGYLFRSYATLLQVSNRRSQGEIQVKKSENEQNNCIHPCHWGLTSTAASTAVAANSSTDPHRCLLLQFIGTLDGWRLVQDSCSITVTIRIPCSGTRQLFSTLSSTPTNLQ